MNGGFFMMLHLLYPYSKNKGSHKSYLNHFEVTVRCSNKKMYVKDIQYVNELN